MDSFTSEKPILSFSKFILGVHKKAQNTAVRSELGRFPLGIDIITNIISYEKRFSDTNTYSLLKEAYTLSKNKNKSWLSKCHRLGSIIFEPANKNPFEYSRKAVQNIMRQLYKNCWKEKISTEAKMRSYI